MNPLIDLYKDPVATLTAIGYACLLLTLIWLSTVGAYRNLLTLSARWTNQRPHKWQYVPPLNFIGRIAVLPLLAWIDAWALAAVIWLLT